MCSSLLIFPITEHFTKSDRNSTFYFACGPGTGLLIIFVHGWPDLGYRHQLSCLAPPSDSVASGRDMRGYRRPPAHGKNEGALTIPVLIFTKPMRRDYTNLNEPVIPSRDWMAQERPIRVNAALEKMAPCQSPDTWPAPGKRKFWQAGRTSPTSLVAI